MRSFIALNPAAAERAALHASLANVRDRALPLRWLDHGGLHLTLKFLGDLESSHVEPLGAALRVLAQRHGPITLRLAGLGAFPSLRRGTVVWVGVEPAPELLALHRDMETALYSLGYVRESKPFRPHVTVARVRTGSRPVDISQLADAYAFSAVSTPATLDLMRSHPGPAGSVYEPLLKLPFAKG